MNTTATLMQLHRIDSEVPLEDQIGELASLQSEGKIRHIGLSEVTVNLFNLAERRRGSWPGPAGRSTISRKTWPRLGALTADAMEALGTAV